MPEEMAADCLKILTSLIVLSLGHFPRSAIAPFFISRQTHESIDFSTLSCSPYS
jgi:hypothetical protein